MCMDMPFFSTILFHIIYARLCGNSRLPYDGLVSSCSHIHVTLYFVFQHIISKKDDNNIALVEVNEFYFCVNSI